ncbi:MAG: zinc-ribbon domain-containing protein [Candidatus Geothermarchaeales archaeon]
MGAFTRKAPRLGIVLSLLFLFIGLSVFSVSVPPSLGSSPTVVSATIISGLSQFVSGMELRVEYYVDVEVSHPNGSPEGTDTEWRAKVSGGKASVTLDVPNNIYKDDIALPVGEPGEHQLASGVGFTCLTSIRGDVEVTGPGRSDKTSLSWPNEGERAFTVSISDEAEEGQTITVALALEVEMELGLEFSDFTVELNGGEVTTSGSVSIEHSPRSMSPKIEETIRVQQPGVDLSILLYLVPVGLVGGIGVWYFVRRRRKASEPLLAQGKEPSVQEPRPSFCPSCGAQARLDADFCHSCGAKLRS